MEQTKMDQHNGNDNGHMPSMFTKLLLSGSVAGVLVLRASYENIT